MVRLTVNALNALKAIFSQAIFVRAAVRKDITRIVIWGFVSGRVQINTLPRKE
jgi:hypothetical protein